MIEVDSVEGLMVWLINFVADKFGNSAILKGGMELRLLDCPRHTNDIDYVFVPFSSKKDVCRIFLEAFRQVPGLKVDHSLNSRCLRCVCECNGLRAQIEINVSQTCESQELTTVSLARQYELQGRIVRGMRFDLALAHKVAAWNERGLIRDLYDCYFMADILAIRPHAPTLVQRLSTSEIRVGRKTRKVSMTSHDLARKIEKTLKFFSQEAVEEQMRDFLAPEELHGLEKKMRIGLRKLIEALDADEI